MKLSKITFIGFIMTASVLAGCAQPTPQPINENPSNPDTATETPSVTPDETPIKEATDVTYYTTTPTPVSYTKFLTKGQVEGTKKSESAYELDLMKFYDVGTIQKQPYQGWKLILLDMGCDGMCMGDTYYRFAYDEKVGTMKLLTKYSSENEYTPNSLTSLFVMKDKLFTLESLDLPETINVPNSTATLTLQEKDDNTAFTYINGKFSANELIKNAKVAFKDPMMGNIYFIENYGCFYVINSDGIMAKYSYNPGFFEGNGQTITWNDGSKPTSMTEKYGFAIRGCGIDGNCYFLENVKMENLTEAGTTSKGIKLYSAKYPKEKADEKVDSTEQVQLWSAYEGLKNRAEYDEKYAANKNITFQEFINRGHILYFQDPFGRFGSIISKSAMPMAECGKPVIYVYPEKQTDVNVQVKIDEFTETIPAYGHNGWTVNAKPNGTLYNYADGQTYPYLFWEGYSSKSVSADKGFVIAKSDVKSFLETSLTQLGLNETERHDFKDFWVTRMLDNPEPYLFVSFIGTRDFNKVAPLSITPAPDTLIRVFMYYQPLREKINVEPITLSSIIRKGFTVVEWGGTSSRPWKK